MAVIATIFAAFWKLKKPRRVSHDTSPSSDATAAVPASQRDEEEEVDAAVASAGAAAGGAGGDTEMEKVRAVHELLARA